MAWSPRRAETYLARFRALPCTTTVTTRIGGGSRVLGLTFRFLLILFSGLKPACWNLFITAALDCSEDLHCLGNLSRNIHTHRHSFLSLRMHACTHAYTSTHSFLYVTLGSSVSIYCIHRYYFDLRIYTISDTTLHALTRYYYFRDRWIAIYTTETIGRASLSWNTSRG